VEIRRNVDLLEQASALKEIIHSVGDIDLDNADSDLIMNLIRRDFVISQPAVNEED
jgi:hypothetical protein